MDRVYWLLVEFFFFMLLLFPFFVNPYPFLCGFFGWSYHLSYSISGWPQNSPEHINTCKKAIEVPFRAKFVNLLRELILSSFSVRLDIFGKLKFGSGIPIFRIPIIRMIAVPCAKYQFMASNRTKHFIFSTE